MSADAKSPAQEPSPQPSPSHSPSGCAITEPVSKKPVLSYLKLLRKLTAVVESGDRVAAEPLLQEFKRRFPVPSVEVLPKGCWESETDELLFATHRREDISQAIENLSLAGWTLTPEEETQLELLSIHWCGWSPTAANHRDDPWMEFLRHRYPTLEGLQPILDCLIWPEEIELYPFYAMPAYPTLFLLATKTKFYVYDFRDDEIYEAGDTLADVIEGISKYSWEEKDGWPILDPVEDETFGCVDDYFPEYWQTAKVAKPFVLVNGGEKFKSRESKPSSLDVGDSKRTTVED
jgi:hypothetical protein